MKATTTKESPVSTILEEWGARWTGPVNGSRSLADFGDPGAEARALRETCGIFTSTGQGHLVLDGPDRQRFLHGLMTCEVKALAPGEGAYGFFSDSKGKVLADGVVLAYEKRLEIALPSEEAEPIREHVKKYIIADRVEVENGQERIAVSVFGPKGAEILATRFGEPLPVDPWRHRSYPVDAETVTLLKNGQARCEGYTLWIPKSLAVGLLRELRGLSASLVPVGDRAVDAMRVDLGVPRFGPDFGGDCFPQETGLEDEAVSYEKGCYLGQEIVARIHYRGQSPRVMARVAIEAGDAPAVGTALSAGGREAGRLGTVVPTSGPGEDGFRA
ncbi:MAG TPA: hypothetical protein VKA53_03600, partial [Thermoanaerobaculia bacterium]|nr:hypothetical protein [Thermoanaerobaculia bacterium]